VEVSWKLCGEFPQSFPTLPRKAKHGPCTHNHTLRVYSQ
jgi:hypothetical protein